MVQMNTAEREPTMNIPPLPTPEQTEAFINAGYTIDSVGRPLHPDYDLLPEQNQRTDKGGFWNWGPNYTADPIILTTEERPQILLITRQDGSLAFPGGFVDPEEEPLQAARREAEEEASFTTHIPETLIYKGIVSDPRTSAHAWPETSAYLFEIPNPTPIKAGDDAKEAGWYYVDEITELYGSHYQLLQMALESRRSKSRTIEEILSIPEEQRETHYIDAGHMAYQHYFTRHHADHLFVKSHDSSRFSDPFREAHSRAYLQKEYSLFHHLKEQNFSFIPNRVALIEDMTLAMDALHPDDGWIWRAPSDERLLDSYISDTLEAFDTLQQIKPPLSPRYHEDIKDTYSTLWEEGWDAIDEELLEKITQKIRQFSAEWTKEQYDASEGLINSLPILRQKAMAMNRDVPLYLAHNDARQSNIAWHPTEGTRLVDWSWGDEAPKNADATMFLIDLVKSGKDISSYLESFNPDHAYTLIGFWLAHSLWETRDGSQTVRQHQIASAIAAFKVVESAL